MSNRKIAEVTVWVLYVIILLYLYLTIKYSNDDKFVLYALLIGVITIISTFILLHVIDKWQDQKIDPNINATHNENSTRPQTVSKTYPAPQKLGDIPASSDRFTEIGSLTPTKTESNTDNIDPSKVYKRRNDVKRREDYKHIEVNKEPPKVKLTPKEAAYKLAADDIERLVKQGNKSIKFLDEINCTEDYVTSAMFEADRHGVPISLDSFQRQVDKNPALAPLLAKYKELIKDKEYANPKSKLEPRINSVTSEEKKNIKIIDNKDSPENFNDIMYELNALIGLESVKKEISTLANYMIFQKMRADEGIGTKIPNLHLVFTGNAGTGKTTVARLIGRIYKQIGLLKGGQTVFANRHTLVGTHVGQTTPKTEGQIKKAKGGVLFIDEAYAVANPFDQDYGHEAIAMLLEYMENDRGEFAVIMAGYAQDMEKFMSYNQGLKSRFSTYIDFPDYSQEDLGRIFIKMATDDDYIIPGETVKKALSELAKQRDSNKKFANAREVRNLLERAEKHQSDRLKGIRGLEKISKSEKHKLLKTILPEDIEEQTYSIEATDQKSNNSRPKIGF